jgi:SAM-dependent methyltransferase
MASTIQSSRDFWNEKARENALWYVSSYGPYEGRDEADFWRSGFTIWNDLKKRTGYTPQPDHVVVEIGCGVGRLSRAISAEVGTLRGSDISSEMVNRANQLGLSNARFSVGDGFSLSGFSDGCADLVLAYCVFQHLPTEDILAGYVREMCRVAAPKGMLAFTIVPRDWRVCLEPLAAFKNRFRRHGPTGIHRKEWRGIRPRKRDVQNLCPIPLKFDDMRGERWLFFGTQDTCCV